MISSLDKLDDFANASYDISDVMDAKAHAFMEQYQNATLCNWMGKAVSHGLRNSCFTVSAAVVAVAAASFAERGDYAFLATVAGSLATWIAMARGRDEATAEYNADIAAKTSGLAFEKGHLSDLSGSIQGSVDAVNLKDPKAVASMIEKIERVCTGSLPKLGTAYRSVGIGRAEASTLLSPLKAVLNQSLYRLRAAQ